MAKRVPTPPEVLERVERLLDRPKAPALLALVVMGKFSLAHVNHVHHLSDALDELYDEAEARAIENRSDIRQLMRNDLAMHTIRTA